MLAIIATTGVGVFSLFPRGEENAAVSRKKSNGVAAVQSYHSKLLNRLITQYGLRSGRWVLKPNEVTHINDAVCYGHTVLQATTAGQEFTQTVKMLISGVGGAPWDAGYFVPDVTGMRAGDKGLLVVWLRTASVNGQQKGTAGKVSIFVEDASSYEKDVYLTVNPSSEWQEYLIPFEAADADPRRVGFHLAFQQQVIE